MKKDNMDELFMNLEGDFDVESPIEGHEARFLERLNALKVPSKKRPFHSTFYKRLMAIAATLIIGLGLFMFLPQEAKTADLANVSPALSKTQDFFTTAISSELNKLKKQRTPETEALVKDALKQMEHLEKQYETLKSDLKESGQDQRVIFAMISNFQSRIDVLKNVLETIEDVKNLKTAHDSAITL